MPRRRSVVAFLIVGLVVLAGGVLFEAVRHSRKSPVIAVDHRAKIHARALAMSAADPDAAERAWDALREAFTLREIVDGEIGERIAGGPFEKRTSWDTGVVDYNYVLGDDDVLPRAEREREALATFDERGGQDHLEVFTRAATAIGPAELVLPGDQTPLAQSVFPELARSREMARALVARMRLAHADDDPAAVAAAFDQLLAIVRTMSYQPGLLGPLTAQAILAMTLRELNHDLTEHEVSAALCRRLLDTLDRRKLAPLELAIETERAAFHDMVQHRFTDDGAGDGRLAEPNIAAAAFARFLGPRRAKVTAIADTYFDRCVEVARLPAAERRAHGFARASYVAGLGGAPSSRFVRNLLPDLDQAIGLTDMARSQIEGTRLLVAIELHIARHGAPPPTLGALVPAILPRVPADPLHGGPFGYLLSENGGFRLYSYGIDGADDGGQFDPDDSMFAYRDAGAGYDAVFNVPRRPVVDPARE